MSNLAFAITHRELDALRVLQTAPAAWPTFKPATWRGLADKALTTTTTPPAITDAGACVVALMEALSVLRGDSVAQPVAVEPASRVCAGGAALAPGTAAPEPRAETSV